MIKGIIFDLNGTVIDILTDEGDMNAYRTVANFLSYQGFDISPEELRGYYFDTNRRQRRESSECYPDFDVVDLFYSLVRHHSPVAWHNLSREKRAELPWTIAEIYRAATLLRLQLYDDVLEVLDDLRGRYRLAAVSDGQSCWTLPEVKSVGLKGYFSPLIISSDLGFRKPDRRMFKLALHEMQMLPGEVLFVGNDMYRDVWGAKRMGIKTIFFKSNQGDTQYHGAEPDYIIYSFSQLPEAVRFLSARQKNSSRRP